MINYKKTLSVVLISTVSAWAVAEELSLNWQRDVAKAPKSGTGSSFSQDKLAIQIPVTQFFWDQDSAKVRLKLERTEFHWQDSSAESDALYSLSVPLSYHQWRGNNTEFIAKFEPGLHSAGTKVAKRAFNLDAEVSAKFYLSRRAYWQLGAVVSRDLGDENLYPLVAYAWKPNASTEVKLGFPYSELHAAWNDEMSGYLRLRPAGGLWVNTEVGGGTGTGGGAVVPDEEDPVEPEQPDDNAGADDDAAPPENQQTASALGSSNKVKYENWQIAAGTQVHWRDEIWFNLETGYAFARKITAPDAAGDTVQARPDNSVYWQLGMKWRF